MDAVKQWLALIGGRSRFPGRRQAGPHWGARQIETVTPEAVSLELQQESQKLETPEREKTTHPLCSWPELALIGGRSSLPEETEGENLCPLGSSGFLLGYPARGITVVVHCFSSSSSSSSCALWSSFRSRWWVFLWSSPFCSVFREMPHYVFHRVAHTLQLLVFFVWATRCVDLQNSMENEGFFASQSSVSAVSKRSSLTCGGARCDTTNSSYDVHGFGHHRDDWRWLAPWGTFCVLPDVAQISLVRSCVPPDGNIITVIAQISQVRSYIFSDSNIITVVAQISQARSYELPDGYINTVSPQSSRHGSETRCGACACLFHRFSVLKEASFILLNKTKTQKPLVRTWAQS